MKKKDGTVIMNKDTKMNRQRKQYTTIDLEIIQEAFEMREQGDTYAGICYWLDISRSTLKRIFKMPFIKNKSGQYEMVKPLILLTDDEKSLKQEFESGTCKTPSSLRGIVYKYMDEYSDETIARSFGVSEAMVMGLSQRTDDDYVDYYIARMSS